MTLKQELYRLCIQYVDQRIKTAEQVILSAKETAENDTKSSAGDKYETTREMMQQEITLNQTQLSEALRLKYALSLINPNKDCKTAEPGSLVITGQGSFFIAVSAGALQFDGQTYYIISAASPIGKAFSGHKEKDIVTFNGKKYRIEKII